MGISTVSGPFRSKNGFQQLDENGEWVPVTGGGGGGGGGTTTIMQWGDVLALPAPTAIGQVYEVDVAYNIYNFGLPSITIELPVIGNGYDSVIVGSIFLQDSNDFPPAPVVGDLIMGVSDFTYSPAGTLGWANFRIVYVGPVSAEGETYNVFQYTADMVTVFGG